MSDYVNTTNIRDKLKGSKEILFKYDNGFIQILKYVGQDHNDKVYAPIITADLQYGNNFEIDLIIEHLHKLVDEIKNDIKEEPQ